MKLLLLSAALVLTSASAHAFNDDISQFEHHAAAGQFEVTPSFGIVAGTSDPKNSSSQGYDHLDTSGAILHVGGEYGIIPQIAVGMNVGFSTLSRVYDGGTKDDQRTNFSGFNDLLFYAHGHVDVPVGRVAYGINFDVAPSKYIEDSHANFNGSSGGNSVEPIVGYEVQTPKAGLFGGQLHYTFEGDSKFRDESGTTVSETKYSGGDEFGLNLFYEYVFHRITFGGALTYAHVANTKNETNGGTSNDDHNNQTGFRIYTPLRFGKHIELLPEMDYVHFNVADSSDSKNINAWLFQVAGRFSF